MAEAANREGIQAAECGNLLLLCLQGWQGLALELNGEEMTERWRRLRGGSSGAAAPPEGRQRGRG